MPARNAEKTISRAIDSILNQTFKNFEFLIVDDVSTDDTLNIVKKYARSDKRIRVIRNKTNRKIAGSLNDAISLAKSGIIARMDADDESYSERLEMQFRKLEKDKSIGVVGAFMEVVNEDGKSLSIRKYPESSGTLKKALFRYSCFGHPVVAFRKEAFDEFDGYREDIFPCEDIDLWFKIGSKYKFATIPKALLKYYIHAESSSHKDLKSIELLGLGVKINAIVKLGYKPTFFDLVYNLLEYSTLWFMLPKLRIGLFNFLRGRNII